MGQFVGNKQGFTLKTARQILKQPPSIVQFAPANPERNQKSRGGVDGRPDPGLPVLALDLLLAARTFLFFTNVHNSSSWVSLSSSDVSRLESTRAQCSPARRITRLTVSLSSPSNRAVARTPTPSAAWWMICLIVSAGRCNPNNALVCVAAKRLPQVRQYKRSRLLSFPYLPRVAMLPCPRRPQSLHLLFGQKHCSSSLMTCLQHALE